MRHAAQAVWTILIFLCLITPAIAAEEKPAGIVQVAEGSVFALAGDAQRPLTPQDPVFLKDTVVSGPQGKVQIMFEDGTVFVMGENASLEVREVRYDFQDRDRNVFDVSMLTGTCRFLTGKIVEQNPERFKVLTPLGTLGIRGTEAGVSIGLSNAPAFSSALQGALGRPGPGLRGALAGASASQAVVAHFTGLSRRPIGFTDLTGRVTSIGRGMSVSVSRDTGAGSPTGISGETQELFGPVGFSKRAATPGPYSSRFAGYDSTVGGSPPGSEGGSGGGRDKSTDGSSGGSSGGQGGPAHY